MTIPDDRRYSKEHEWIRIEGDRGIVGITDYAQKQLGDVVYVELPEVGAPLGPMQVFGTIESVKAVSELFSPVSGKVLEVNRVVMDRPELVNSDPYGGAWLIAVELKDRAELDALMSASQYQAYLDEEAKS